MTTTEAERPIASSSTSSSSSTSTSSSSSFALPEAPASSTASLSSTSSLPPPEAKPSLPEMLRSHIDWKDTLASVVSIVFALACFARLAGASFESPTAGLLAGVVVPLVFVFVRRRLGHGPRPIVRTGPAAWVARAASSSALLFGVVTLWSNVRAFDVVGFAVGTLCLALGGVLDHVLRTPPEELP